MASSERRSMKAIQDCGLGFFFEKEVKYLSPSLGHGKHQNFDWALLCRRHHRQGRLWLRNSVRPYANPHFRRSVCFLQCL